MRFLFLNQYGPPEPVPTARLLGELAEGLRASGHPVEILSDGRSYQERHGKGGRLRRELQASWTILGAGLRPRAGRPDVVLALSSPPGLPVVGALLAWWHGARLAHWAMDLYPELALALGEIKPGSLVTRIVRLAMRWAYRRAALVVALDEDMRVHLQSFCRSTVRVMEPWPAQGVEPPADEAVRRHGESVPPEDPSGRWTWLYSGNLGRAHEWQTLLAAQALLEARGLPIRLVFQGDGAARPAAMAQAAKLGLRRCEWKGYVPEEELRPALLRARVLIVTQRPETRGLLWPSKLAMLERLPRPVLFVGPCDGAIAGRLRERGNAGVFAPGQARAIADWIETSLVHPSAADLVQAQRRWPTQKDSCAVLERWLVECVESVECIG